jgi:serine O-acetyltransferase
MMLISEIQEDLRRCSGRAPSSFRILKRYFSDSGFKAVMLYRIARWLFVHRFPLFPRLLTMHAIARTGAEIMPQSSIGPGLVLKHSVGVVVGSGSVVGRNCTILQGVTLGENYKGKDDHKYPRVGDDVTLCAGAKLLGGIRVGNGALIGANAVVILEVPANSVVVGVPGRVVRTISGATAM